MPSAIDRRQFALWSSALAGACAMGLSPSAAAQQAKLVVNTYGGRWEKFWRSDLLPPFTKATGIDPTVDVGLGKNFIANIRAAGVNNPPYSILMVNENIASLVRSEGYFEPIPADKVPNLANVYPNLRNAGNNGVRAIISAIGWVVFFVMFRTGAPIRQSLADTGTAIDDLAPADEPPAEGRVEGHG